MNYTGQYRGFVHPVGERFVVGIASPVGGGVLTRDGGCRRVGPRRIKVVLAPPLQAETFEQLVERGAPTYANERAAIKAARRLYPELRTRYPWRTDAALEAQIARLAS